MSEDTKAQEKKERKLIAPRRMDIVDMPSDHFNVTGKLRNELCKQVNYCREYPAKMEVLAEVLMYTLERMVQIQELDAAEKKAKSERLAKAAEEREKAKSEAQKPAPEKPSEPEKPTAPAKPAAQKPAPTKPKPAPANKAPTKPEGVTGQAVASAPVKQ